MCPLPVGHLSTQLLGHKHGLVLDQLVNVISILTLLQLCSYVSYTWGRFMAPELQKWKMKWVAMGNVRHEGSLWLFLYLFWVWGFPTKYLHNHRWAQWSPPKTIIAKDLFWTQHKSRWFHWLGQTDPVWPDGELKPSKCLLQTRLVLCESLTYVYFLSTCISPGLSLPHSSKRCPPHTSTVPSFLFALAGPHAEVHCLSPFVNNTWPLRFWMWRENKLLGLGCFLCRLTSWDPHTHSVWPAAEGNTEWHPSAHCYRQLIQAYTEACIQTFTYAVCVCRSVRPECK